MSLAEVKLGLQSYSLRRLSFEDALREVANLGLKFVEAYPEHLPPSVAEVGRARELCDRYGVRIVAHGVNHMPRDEGKLRELFEFARQLGLEVLTADPDPDSFDLLDEMVEEYGVAVAIHNHGPGHRYATVSDVLRAVEGHSELIGMCLDTGHLVRAGEDPVEAVRRLGGRLHALHLKDVSAEGRDVVLGSGVVDFRALFRALEELGLLRRVVLSVEYEPEPENPLPGIRKSLEHVIRALGSL